jgi:hypothetical protein
LATAVTRSEPNQAIMKEKLYSQKSFPKNRDELITSFFRIWNELPAS